MLWQRLIPDLVRASLSSDFYDLLGDSRMLQDNPQMFFRTCWNVHPRLQHVAECPCQSCRWGTSKRGSIVLDTGSMPRCDQAFLIRNACQWNPRCFQWSDIIGCSHWTRQVLDEMINVSITSSQLFTPKMFQGDLLSDDAAECPSYILLFSLTAWVRAIEVCLSQMLKSASQFSSKYGTAFALNQPDNCESLL